MKNGMKLKLLVDGKPTTLNNPGVRIGVTIPYKPSAEELNSPAHIVVVTIDDNGHVVAVPSGRYDGKSGAVTFTVDRFGQYGVSFVQKHFDDLGKLAWAKESIEALASKGAFQGVSETSFAPASAVTRAEFLVMLLRTLGISAPFDSSDVQPSDFFMRRRAWAKRWA